jgi:pimeloyl-ACP methyl ester carboxylesterase
MKKLISLSLSLIGILPLFAVTACLSSSESSSTDPSKDGGTQTQSETSVPTTDAGSDPATNPINADTIKYRDLAMHPGCSTAGLSTRGAGNEDSPKSNNMKPYEPASIPGYKCASKVYPIASEDTSKPIVLLVHGNSSTPSDWEAHPMGGTPMLSERLTTAGYKTIAVDLRYDLVDDPVGPDGQTGNPAKNMDHGWAVPIVTHFLESVMAANPTRRFSIVSFSLGPTVVRDSLRRLHRAGKKPFARLQHLVFGAGAHHGVSTFRALCGKNLTMRGTVTCEMGDRTAFSVTDFLKPLNGDETPCADGNTAWGQAGVCDGNKVLYTTVTMRDPVDGTYQDEFVSESAAKLSGADNKVVELTDTDATLYFYNGLFKSHYGAVRSETGLKLILEALAK